MRWVSTLGTGGASPTASRDDLAGRRQVALEEGGRDRQHRRHVVEAVLVGVVGGQECGDVDLDLRAGRAPRCGTRPGSGGGTSRCGPRRDRGRRPGRAPSRDKPRRPVRRHGRAGAARGRHRADAQLADHLLPDRRVASDVRQVGRVEGEPRRAQPLVVADDAVAVEHRSVRRGVGGRLGTRGRGRPTVPDSRAARTAATGALRAEKNCSHSTFQAVRRDEGRQQDDPEGSAVSARPDSAPPSTCIVLHAGRPREPIVPDDSAVVNGVARHPPGCGVAARRVSLATGQATRAGCSTDSSLRRPRSRRRVSLPDPRPRHSVLLVARAGRAGSPSGDVLPEEKAGGPERRVRWVRSARPAMALSMNERPR